MAEQTAQYDHIGNKYHSPPDFVVDGAGFDHGAGHSLLFLDDAKAPNCQKNNGFKGLGNYSEWPKVAGAVIKATERLRGGGLLMP
jgi:hypothetical protein